MENNLTDNPIVITFHGHKGGVGRTLALANMAFEAFISNKRVFVIDNDLEAPGISYKFASTVSGMADIKKEEEIKRFTMVDVLSYFKKRIVDPAHDGLWSEDEAEVKRRFWFNNDGILSEAAINLIDKEIFKPEPELAIEDRFTIENCVYDFKPSHIIKGGAIDNTKNKGWIKYIPAGKLNRHREYWTALNSLDLSEAYRMGKSAHEYHPLSTEHCLDWLISYVKKTYNPDYIFIDARAGFTQMSNRACSVLSDQVFLFSSNIIEGFEGIYYMYYEIYKNNKLYNKDTDVKFVYSRMLVDNYDRLVSDIVDNLDEVFTKVSQNIKGEADGLYFNISSDEEKNALKEFENEQPYLNPIIIRHSDGILSGEEIVLANVSKDNLNLAKDMLKQYQNLKGYKMEDMFSGVEFFIGNPTLYYELFYNHAIDTQTKEAYFYLLRFYGNLELKKDLRFYELIEKYFSFFINDPEQINESMLGLFLTALEERNTGNNYNYTIYSNDELTKLFDIFTDVEFRYDFRRRWLRLKIYADDETVKSDGMKKLEDCIFNYLRTDSRVSEKDTKAYVKDYLEKIKTYGKDAKHTFRFKDRVLKDYCERHYDDINENLRTLYYLAEFKVRSEVDENYMRDLISNKNKLTILIKDDLHTLNYILNTLSGDQADDFALRDFIRFLIKLIDEDLISEEEKMEINKVFFLERSRRLNDVFVRDAAKDLRKHVE